MSKQRDNLLLVFAIGIYLLMLHSMNAWFLWNIDRMWLEVITLMIGVVLVIRNRKTYHFSKGSQILVLLFSLAILWNSKIGLGSILMLPISFFIMFGLSKQSLKKMLQWWTNLYAFILVVSLIAWALSWSSILPDFGTIVHPAHDNYTYTNYILCIRGAFYDIRFNSIFLEPGHTAMIAAFTIFVNRFNLKSKAVIAILVCTVFTFSLAGYILMFLGYCIIALQSLKVKLIVKNVIPYILILSVVYYAGITYQNGNNLLNELILERMQMDDEKGFSGNNRTGEITNNTYESFLKTPEVISGLSPQRYSNYVERGLIEGAGYKLYVMQKGIIGILLVLLAYFYIYRYSGDKRLTLGLLLVYIAAFWQRAYPFWYSWLVIFYFSTIRQIQGKNKN